MPIRIESRFYCKCRDCKQDVEIVGDIPFTNPARGAQNRQEAWGVAHSTGWSGSYESPRCPSCTKANPRLNVGVRGAKL